MQNSSSAYLSIKYTCEIITDTMVKDLGVISNNYNSNSHYKYYVIVKKSKIYIIYKRSSTSNLSLSYQVPNKKIRNSFFTTINP